MLVKFFVLLSRFSLNGNMFIMNLSLLNTSGLSLALKRSRMSFFASPYYCFFYKKELVG